MTIPQKKIANEIIRLQTEHNRIGKELTQKVKMLDKTATSMAMISNMSDYIKKGVNNA